MNQENYPDWVVTIKSVRAIWISSTEFPFNNEIFWNQKIMELKSDKFISETSCFLAKIPLLKPNSFVKIVFLYGNAMYISFKVSLSVTNLWTNALLGLFRNPLVTSW